MIKLFIVILLALPLLSVAPVPAAAHTVYWTRIAARTSAQACTWEIAPARLRQTIEDPIGYPYGVVTAFSCDGDAAAVMAELETRAGAMQAEAAAYRQAHPIGGVK